MESKAPGVVKFFGEHAVVYGNPSMAAAVNLYSNCSISHSGNVTGLIISLKNFGIEKSFSSADIKALYSGYKKIEDSVSNRNDKAQRTRFTEEIKRYKNGSGIDKMFLPYLIIIGFFEREYGINTDSLKVEISSEIPMQKGLASSAACSASFAIAIDGFFNTKIEKEKLLEVARLGEIVVHENINAGIIDTATSFYGGLISSANGTISRLASDFTPDLLIIDTGPKKPTSETVGHVTKFVMENEARAKELFSEIKECYYAGIEALKEHDVKKLGESMYKNQECLKELGVSSDSLDKCVSLAKEFGFYGAKLSGGGGGGIAIAIPNKDTEEAFIKKSEAMGYRVSKAHFSSEGANIVKN
jgi:mevalonate kinase